MPKLTVEIDDLAVIARYVEMKQESVDPTSYEGFVDAHNVMIEARHYPQARLPKP